jgi:hypothetical protein
VTTDTLKYSQFAPATLQLDAAQRCKRVSIIEGGLPHSHKRSAQSLKLSPSECESVLRLAESQLEVSVSRLIRDQQN